MFKSKDSTFVNEYGYDETYTTATLESYLSGHLYHGSAFETDSDCGNCDGARCSSCKEIFMVTSYGIPIDVVNKYGWTERHEHLLAWRRFTNFDDALAYFNTL